MHRLALGAFLLSVDEIAEHIMSVSLNAPFGARCFLTLEAFGYTDGRYSVLMHLLALGAF